jgi:hypothetical protein
MDRRVGNSADLKQNASDLMMKKYNQSIINQARNRPLKIPKPGKRIIRSLQPSRNAEKAKNSLKLPDIEKINNMSNRDFSIARKPKTKIKTMLPPVVINPSENITKFRSLTGLIPMNNTKSDRVITPLERLIQADLLEMDEVPSKSHAKGIKKKIIVPHETQSTRSILPYVSHRQSRNRILSTIPHFNTNIIKRKKHKQPTQFPNYENTKAWNKSIEV